MQSLALDDDNTLEAIGILADVLDDVSDRVGLDTVLVSKALRQVIATRSQPAFDFASRAFNTLDPTVRRRVAADAGRAAQESVDLRHRVMGFLSTPTRRGQPAQQASSLLTALNHRSRRRDPGLEG
jgi:hypothetical protein